MNRRSFLKNTGFASTAMFVPQFLAASKAQSNSYKGKKLVIIQWTGGNDGLNTVVPFRNDIYYKNRPKLAIPKNKVLKLNDELGLNPVMGGLKSLYDDGLVSVLNNVGYPDPNRSHFRSMDIWQTGSGVEQNWTTGWIGRYLDQHCDDCKPYTALEVDDTLNLALKGKERSGFAASNLSRLKRTANDKFLKNLAFHHDHDHDENVAYLYKTMIDTQSSAAYLHQQSKMYRSQVVYPKNSFGKDLKQVTQLIVADTETQIYYVNLNGFDTHAYQKKQQERLLKRYSDGIKAFVKDLKQNDQLDDTLIMTFSEFGRRVKENASQGTDHGTANNVYLIGGKLKKAGIFNEAPNLSTLDKGDLIYSLDFRRIYATLLEKWLGVDSTPILQEKFSPLKIV